MAVGMSVPLLLVGVSAGSLLPRAGAVDGGASSAVFGVLLLAVALWMRRRCCRPALGVAGWGLLLLLSASLLRAFDRLGEAASLGARFGKALGLALGLAGAAQIVGATAGAVDPLQPLQPFVRRADEGAGLARADATPPTSGLSPAATGGVGAASGRAASPGDLPPELHAVAGLSFRRVGSVTELEAALREAGRPALLDFYADWCVSCKEMERYTFTDPQVRERLGSVLLLQADVTRNSDAERELLKRFKLFGPPGIVFFDASGHELPGVRVIGYQQPARFLQSLKSAGL